MAAFRPWRCGLVAPVCPLVKAMRDSREQFAAGTGGVGAAGGAAALRLGA